VSAVRNIADNTEINRNKLGIYCNQVDAGTLLGLSACIGVHRPSRMSDQHYSAYSRGPRYKTLLRHRGNFNK
jgi:hypothetical protein